jgi:hypothetical protein
MNRELLAQFKEYIILYLNLYDYHYNIKLLSSAKIFLRLSRAENGNSYFMYKEGEIFQFYYKSN